MNRSTATAMVLLDRDAIQALLDVKSCVAAVERAFADHARGLAMPSGILHIDADDGEFHIKAGGLQGERPFFVCKINGGFFQNRSCHGLANINGVIVLSDGRTGVPVALLESGWITRVRTAAATVVAAKYLARSDSSVVTVCGAGAQGEIQLKALAEAFPLERATIWSRRVADDVAERLTSDIGIPVGFEADLGRATEDANIIVTCTPSTQWFLGRQHVRPGTFVAAVGADSPSKQELEPALVAAANVVTDLTDQCAHVGELHHAIAAGLMEATQVRGELGHVINGTVIGRQSDKDIVIFDSTGTAIQDAAAAIVVWERHALGSGRQGHRCADANRAPATSDSSFAHWIWG